MQKNLNYKIHKTNLELDELHEQKIQLEKRVKTFKLIVQLMNEIETIDSVVDTLDSLVIELIVRVRELNPDYPIVSHLEEIIKSVTKSKE